MDYRMGDRASGCPDRIFVWFFEIINNLFFFLQKETKKSSKKMIVRLSRHK